MEPFDIIDRANLFIDLLKELLILIRHFLVLFVLLRNLFR